MGNDKLALPKSNVTTAALATPATQQTAPPPKGQIVAAALHSGLVKTDSEAIKSTNSTQDTANEIKSLENASDKKGKSAKVEPNEPSKMEIATEIYKRMMQTKGMTRKEVLEQFVSHAKLSKAGASTYFQLIKAKG
jgi:hypothetical protein